MAQDEQEKTPEVAAAAAPELEWLEDGVPRAARFDDTYFSRAGGRAEAGHVFLAGNGLPERWQGKSRFTIGELGFGTGLNLLATLALRQDQPDPPHLTFLTVEAFPLTIAQLERAHSAFPELGDLACQLRLALAGARIGAGAHAGWHRMDLSGATLWLGLGDATVLVPELAAGGALPALRAALPVDAWFLDGFAPSRNPELWQPGLMQAVHAATAPGGSFATYTSAGWVRRGLAAAGFTVEKRKGFAGKRQMSVGWRGEVT
ncbi:tRNA (5-methylaminomethyl-2-thiouridine)(34)-methyltransferase MnmD [Microvirga tunisiensis]|uniref:tRNA (5-methylaminomethyl-2-thiouridine)(34)-methyltransferase MnmD n=1 Tax=Pannonibacter tanglangensis TaxID=2750084 RepID=A0A7X5F2H9_9HYPH|nr:tRNA (5-methylaminomethyl-2-thiouridine)(34)-methyltransferase MnmD [Pannonibacter sp. XCT-53]NBN78578.1 tRNA (5-methylaminomethyl-2-thiouridine)(34)-methyltransferase MnmD [Pannonibacter sp. XCT-53]